MRIPNKKFSAVLLSEIASRLLSLRAKAGMSQAELARNAGVTRASISALEGGQQGISVETLCKLAAVLRVEPGDMLPTRHQVQSILRSGVSAHRLPEDIVEDYLREGGHDG